MNTRRLSLHQSFASCVLAAFTILPPLAPQPASGQVYSCNVPGYVNVVLTNGYQFIGNPLWTPPNTLNDVMRPNATVPDGTAVYLWDASAQSFGAPATFSSAAGVWFPNYELPPGRGFVVHSLEAWTNTFVGEVFQGTNLIPIVGSNRLSLVSRVFPMITNLADVFWPADPYLESVFPRVDGAEVYVFQTASQSYANAYIHFNGFGWFGQTQAGNTNGPMMELAGSFFVRNPSFDTNWFTILEFCPSSPMQSKLLGRETPPPRILKITVNAGNAVLEIAPSDSPYNIEWSPNALTWTTLATGQTGEVWSGTIPPGPQGCFRLTQP